MDISSTFFNLGMLAYIGSLIMVTYKFCKSKNTINSIVYQSAPTLLLAVLAALSFAIARIYDESALGGGVFGLIILFELTVVPLSLTTGIIGIVKAHKQKDRWLLVSSIILIISVIVQPLFALIVFVPVILLISKLVHHWNKKAALVVTLVMFVSLIIFVLPQVVPQINTLFHQTNSSTSNKENKTIEDKFDLDEDGLTGNAEAKYKTDPNKQDTDSDMIPDGNEVEYHLDPLKADTDGNGVSDGSQFINITEIPKGIEKDEMAYPVFKFDVQGKDLLWVQLDTFNDSFLDEKTFGYLRVPYLFFVPKSAKNIELTYHVDKKLFAGKDPHVYLWDNDTHELNLLPKQTINNSEGLITARLNNKSLKHEMYFIVLDKIEVDNHPVNVKIQK